MGVWEILLIAVGLSMDAFAVSVCKGLSLRRMSWGKAGLTGLYFGGFQALMPLVGYFLGVQFEDKIKAVDHWIALVLLCIIGVNMIREALHPGDECEECDASFDFRNMVMLALATSIDALAVGVTFAFLQVNIWLAVAFIGATTFLLSALGVKVGNVFGNRFKAKGELAGGAILILMGVKILLEHTGIL